MRNAGKRSLCSIHSRTASVDHPPHPATNRPSDLDPFEELYAETGRPPSRRGLLRAALLGSGIPSEPSNWSNLLFRCLDCFSEAPATPPSPATERVVHPEVFTAFFTAKKAGRSASPALRALSVDGTDRGGSIKASARRSGEAQAATDTAGPPRETENRAQPRRELSGRAPLQ